MLPNNYQELLNRLSSKIDSKRLIIDPLKTLAYGTDASFYRLIPKIAVLAHTEKEVVDTLALCKSMNISVTFRAAGTSLSGQAITDSVLIVATHKWKNYEILNGGNKIRLQPGIIGARANTYLTSYGKKIGPDPASINAAMIGGIVNNNASGMCCGTAQNSYNTIADARIIFYDGTILDTADLVSIENFKKVHPEIIEGVEDIRDKIKADAVLYERIIRKFKIKNTTGYSINAFTDYEDPIEIIKHLIVGSEGTLAFVSDITFNTVQDFKYKACTLMIYETIELACKAVPFLKESPVEAVEFLDRDCIRSVEEDANAPDFFKTLPETVGVLLVEIQADTQEEMDRKEQEIRSAIESIPVLRPYKFTSDPVEYNFNWKARKGLLPTVGGLRKTGTTCLIEDVAFPVSCLAEAAIAIKELFKKHEYHDAVLFGHALEGNLHLVFSQDFSNPKEVKRYSDLMDELVVIVVDRFDGSLKAEHGTGRNMAPFVEKEWGEAAYKLMVQIKNTFDPESIINPGVIINNNPNIHLENLKPLPAADEIIDKCMECGFCEPNCVSEGLTLSPRHRIVIGREIAELERTGKDNERLKILLREADYNVDATCATDGLCMLACPVGIDTGVYVKQIRNKKVTAREQSIAKSLANNFEGTVAKARTGLKLAHTTKSVLGNSLLTSISESIGKLSGYPIPKWNDSMPYANQKINENITENTQGLKVVYFPSCINRAMGKSDKYPKDEVALTEKAKELLERAGYNIIYPKNINGLCCGMPFSSKGFFDGAERKSNELEELLYEASEGGKHPILYDMSPCFYTSMGHFTKKEMKVYDPIRFMLEFVMPKLEVKQPKNIATVFPICSVKKSGLLNELITLTKMCAKEVKVIDTNCCGFAGDRGFTHPELNEHGQRHLKEQIPEECTEGYSTSRTCEIGMEKYGGINFKSIFYLIDEVTK